MNKTSAMYATDVRNRLMLLSEERFLAHEHGLDDDRAYMADLDHEIESCREAYIGAAVTEIALLHAELDGPNCG